MSVATQVTAEELLLMSRNEGDYELIEGELREMSPAGWRHGAIVIRLGGLLDRHVTDQGLGMVIGGDPGFILARDPDTVLAPDIAFIRKDRIPVLPLRDAFWTGPPDLAVEVMSPGDTVNEVHDKALAWLEAGTSEVWVINPASHTVSVSRAASDTHTFTEADDLTSPTLLPGFRCPVAELFASP